MIALIHTADELEHVFCVDKNNKLKQLLIF
jgi:hypothetical protein